MYLQFCLGVIDVIDFIKYSIMSWNIREIYIFEMLFGFLFF